MHPGAYESSGLMRPLLELCWSSGDKYLPGYGVGFAAITFSLLESLGLHYLYDLNIHAPPSLSRLKSNN